MKQLTEIKTTLNPLSMVSTSGNAVIDTTAQNNFAIGKQRSYHLPCRNQWLKNRKTSQFNWKSHNRFSGIFET